MPNNSNIRRFLDPVKLIFDPNPEPNRYQRRQNEIVVYRDNILHETATLIQQIEKREKPLDNQQVHELLQTMRQAPHTEALKAFYALREYGFLQNETYKSVSFSGANLSRVVIIDIDLSGIDLSHANLSGSYIARVDLRHANLTQVNLSNAVMEHVNLAEAVLDGANLEGCWLDNPEAINPGMPYTLVGASLNQVNLRNAFISGDFSKASLVHADLQDSWLRSVDFNDANLNNANLVGVVGDFAKWRGGTIMPNGDPINARTNPSHRFTYPQHPNFWQPNTLSTPD